MHQVDEYFKNMLECEIEHLEVSDILGMYAINDLMDMYTGIVEEWVSSDAFDIKVDEVYDNRGGIANIIKKAAIYLMSDKTPENEELLLTIIGSDFNCLEEDYKSRSELSIRLFTSYLNFLIEYALGNITDEYIQVQELTNPWLKNIRYNRGYKTLNEMARKVLNEVVSRAISKQEVHKLVDEYFFRNARTDLLQEYAEPYTHSIRDLLAFKEYQKRIMYADCLVNLKRQQRSFAEAFDPTLLNSIIDVVNHDDYFLPSDETERYRLYDYFFSSFVNTLDYEYLKNSHTLEPIPKVNPIYFLD